MANKTETTFAPVQKKWNAPPPKPFIKEITNFGLVRVGFTRPIVLPTYKMFTEFND